jgi:hypothetical protein
MSSPAEADLRAQEAKLVAAMLARNLTALSALFDAEYVFTSGNGGVWGRDRALLDFNDPGYRLDRLKVEVERAIPLAGGGVVVGRSSVAGQAGGASVSGCYRFTRVWRFAEGKWTILATHTSVALPAK